MPCLGLELGGFRGVHMGIKAKLRVFVPGWQEMKKVFLVLGLARFK